MSKKKKTKKIKKKNSTKRYGKYGVIQRNDNHSKQEEFIAWLIEVKKQKINAMNKIEEKNYRQEFIEDYNTATLPKKKYYNIQKWNKKMSKKSSKNLNELNELNEQKDQKVLNDEERLLRERQFERENWKLANEKMRLEKMVSELKAAKQSKRSAFKSALERHKHPDKQSTFESIADKRQAQKRKQGLDEQDAGGFEYGD